MLARSRQAEAVARVRIGDQREWAVEFGSSQPAFRILVQLCGWQNENVWRLQCLNQLQRFSHARQVEEQQNYFKSWTNFIWNQAAQKQYFNHRTLKRSSERVWIPVCSQGNRHHDWRLVFVLRWDFRNSRSERKAVPSQCWVNN